MRALEVVVLQPRQELLIAFLRVEVMANVGPLAQGSLNEALGFAVGARSVGSGEAVLDAELEAGGAAPPSAIFGRGRRGPRPPAQSPPPTLGQVLSRLNSASSRSPASSPAGRGISRAAVSTSARPQPVAPPMFIRHRQSERPVLQTAMRSAPDPSLRLKNGFTRDDALWRGATHARAQAFPRLHHD